MEGDRWFRLDPATVLEAETLLRHDIALVVTKEPIAVGLDFTIISDIAGVHSGFRPGRLPLPRLRLQGKACDQGAYGLCKDGPGWRGAEGTCVSKAKLGEICGSPPGAPCNQEAARASASAMKPRDLNPRSRPKRRRKPPAHMLTTH